MGRGTLDVEIRDDDAERSLGLSGRAVLDDDAGMLFLFNSPQRPLFWMKDMLMDIDMIWIRDGVVVDMHEYVPAPTLGEPRLATRVSREDVDSVLEVAAGWVERHGLEIGDTIRKVGD